MSVQGLLLMVVVYERAFREELLEWFRNKHMLLIAYGDKVGESVRIS
jgi:hypothetical protein